MRGKKRWIAKMNEKNRIYTVYSSLRQAGYENFMDTETVRTHVRFGTPDDSGFYYRACESVEVRFP